MVKFSTSFTICMLKLNFRFNEMESYQGFIMQQVQGVQQGENLCPILFLCQGKWTDFHNRTRDHSVYGLSQWKTMLQCNIVFNWLNPYTEWSLRTKPFLCPPTSVGGEQENMNAIKNHRVFIGTHFMFAGCICICLHSSTS